MSTNKDLFKLSLNELTDLAERVKRIYEAKIKIRDATIYIEQDAKVELTGHVIDNHYESEDMMFSYNGNIVTVELGRSDSRFVLLCTYRGKKFCYGPVGEISIDDKDLEHLVCHVVETYAYFEGHKHNAKQWMNIE